MIYPPAVVMNMFYTGLGIARSLGERGIPVIGLTAQKGIYGNFTRYARIVSCPDSRRQPEELAAFLIAMGKKMERRGVIFPTRDDDVVFLDRFRDELDPYYVLTVPEHGVAEACLDKWQTCQWAQSAGVASPKCWLIEGEEDLLRQRAEFTYPSVLKAVEAHHWRRGGNWHLVGGRKAIAVSSWQELLDEYTAIARADKRALLQEMVPGGDDCLVIAACYMNREKKWVAGFNTQKLAQSPELFGTGCIVQSANYPEVLQSSRRLLEKMQYTGIAEVEYKWDAAKREYLLIEINPRPWDQHRLGKACGVDLVYLAYCDHAGLPMPEVSRLASDSKWIAEDALIMAALRLLRRRDPKLRSLLRLMRGRRIYAICSFRDALPGLAYFLTSFLPSLIGEVARSLWSTVRKRWPGHTDRKKGLAYDENLEKGKGLH